MIVALVLVALLCAGDRRAAEEPRKPYASRLPQPPPREPMRYTVCGIAGAENCWTVGGPIR